MLRIDPPAFLQDPALRAVLAALPQARLVGGCVRDAIAGVAVADIDLASPLAPDLVIAALQAAGLRAVATGLAHGTVTAIAGGRGFEVTTLRRDVATDGRHAIVSFDAGWAEDAARRDFTFNALSMTPDGVVHDLFDGVADLRAGRVRFVGDPAARLAEDRLRALRYFRFHARFGAEAPDAPTQAALRGAAGWLHLLSAERIAAELKRILAVADPMAALRLMAELGVLQAVLSDATRLERLDALVADGAPADPMLRLAALCDGTTTLRLAGAEAARLQALWAGPVPRADDDDAALRRLLADAPREALIDRVWLAGGSGALRARLAAMPVPVFPLEGRDLLALGVAPGPGMGAVLRELRRWWLDGGCVADRQACLIEAGRREQRGQGEGCGGHGLVQTEPSGPSPWPS